MKSFRKELWFNIPTRRAFVNITPQVEESLKESGIKEGLALVNAMHITASVFINDDEPGFIRTMMNGWRSLLRTNRSRSTGTTVPGKTMGTPT